MNISSYTIGEWVFYVRYTSLNLLKPAQMVSGVIRGYGKK